MRMSLVPLFMSLALSCQASGQKIDFDYLDWGVSAQTSRPMEYHRPSALPSTNAVPLILFCVIVWHFYAETEDLPFAIAISFDA